MKNACLIIGEEIRTKVTFIFQVSLSLSRINTCF